MKKILIISFIFVLFIILIGISMISVNNKNNKNNENKELNKIENYTKELFTIIESIANSKCITPALKTQNDSFIANNIEALKIIERLAISGKAATPASIKEYNEVYQKYLDAYSKLKDCSAYCFQGDSSSGNCICPQAYPIPVQIGDKLYCTNEDCTKIPNATFVPSTSSDPSTNKCVCATGYTSDPNGGSYCYSNEVTTTMNNYTNNINTAITNLSNLSPINVFGSYKNTNGSLYMSTSSDIPISSSKSSSLSYKLSSIECAEECLKDPKYNSFSFDGATQICNLFTSSPTILLISNTNGSKIVGTKNTDILNNSIEYTFSQTEPITIPNNVKSINIILVGGGGGGARGGGWIWNNIGGGGGGGGGSGEIVKNTINLESSQFPYSFTINIGEGGLQENDGKNTTFTLNNSLSTVSTITALGGKQGTKGTVYGVGGLGGLGGGLNSESGKGKDGSQYADRVGNPGNGGEGGISELNIKSGRGGVGGQGLKAQNWVVGDRWENPNGGRKNYLDPPEGPFTGPLPGDKGSVIIKFNY